MTRGWGWCLGLALAATACGGPRRPVVLPPAGEMTSPWRIPASEDATQRLLRADVDSTRGSGRLRLTLRLAGDAYELLAADALGRPVWTASVRGDRAVFLDHREASWCEAPSDRPLPALPLGGAPLVAIPAVLLGRLPVPPVDDSPQWREGGLEYRTAGGGRLVAGLDAGRIVRWTLWVGKEPAYWWAQDDRGGVLTARREGIVLRWQEVVREPLRAPLAPPSPPASYERRACDAARAE